MCAVTTPGLSLGGVDGIQNNRYTQGLKLKNSRGSVTARRRAVLDSTGYIQPRIQSKTKHRRLQMIYS